MPGRPRGVPRNASVRRVRAWGCGAGRGALDLWAVAFAGGAVDGREDAFAADAQQQGQQQAPQQAGGAVGGAPACGMQSVVMAPEVQADRGGTQPARDGAAASGEQGAQQQEGQQGPVAVAQGAGAGGESSRQ